MVAKNVEGCVRGVFPLDQGLLHELMHLQSPFLDLVPLILKHELL